MFKTYAEAIAWVETKTREDKGFCASEEYRKFYPEIKALWESENNAVSAEAQKAMLEVGVKYGDRVEYVPISALPGQVATGQIINVRGIPKVKLDPQCVTDKKHVRWHKGWVKEVA